MSVDDDRAGEDQTDDDQTDDEAATPIVGEARLPLDLLKQGNERLFKIAMGMVVGEAIAMWYFDHWKE